MLDGREPVNELSEMSRRSKLGAETFDGIPEKKNNKASQRISCKRRSEQNQRTSDEKRVASKLETSQRQ